MSDCCDVQVVVVQAQPAVVAVAQPEYVVITVCEQGPAGPGGGGTGGDGGAVVAVTSSRALTAEDSGRVLQCTNGITLTVPVELPVNFACRLMMNSSQVWSGGSVNIALASGVTLNGSGDSPRALARPDGSTSPWLAFLQHETGSEAYSVFALGAELSEVVITSYTYEVGVYETGVYE